MDDGREGDRRGGVAVRRITSDDDVAVIGSGTMGAGIAEVAARAGHAVRPHDVRPPPAARLHDPAPTAAVRAAAAPARRLDRDVARGRLERAGADDTLARVRVV